MLCGVRSHRNTYAWGWRRLAPDAGDSSALRPFTIAFPEQALEDLRSRIRATRWPEAETHASQGVSRSDLESLAAYWADGYDWRRCELAINAWPQLVTEVQGLAIHAIHVRSRHEHALPIVLTHGWPGSVLEFLDVIGPLVDPPDASDAFHVVIPSLPGYGFSGKPTEPGWDVDRVAGAWVDLMARLGYDRFAAQGGDWGAMVTTAIGRNHPDHVIGIHLNMPQGKEPAGPYDLSERDRRAASSMAEFFTTGHGYMLAQRTRPQTLAYGLTDSPVALCAWILEKLVDWADGDPLSDDQKLDDVTLYWLTGTAASAARLYWENPRGPGLAPVSVPTGCSLFPGEPLSVPRPYAGEVYRNLRYWHELDRGGHFPAWEQPELFVGEVRQFFRMLR